MNILFALILPILVIWTLVGVALFYLLVKRKNDKKKENFEKRDN